MVAAGSSGAALVAPAAAARLGGLPADGVAFFRGGDFFGHLKATIFPLPSNCLPKQLVSLLAKHISVLNYTFFPPISKILSDAQELRPMAKNKLNFT